LQNLQNFLPVVKQHDIQSVIIGRSTIRHLRNTVQLPSMQKMSHL